MASIAKLVVSLGANISDFQTDMQRAGRISQRELRKMERDAKRLNDSWNRNFKLAGAAVAGGLVLATKAAIKFEKAMAEVSTLIDDTSGLEKLSKNVRALSVEFGQSPVTQAKALYQIISAGASDAATQMEQLTAANKLAVGGVTDVATAADGLTTVLNAYAGSGMTAEEVSDILFTTMRGGKTTIGELSQSIGTVATIAGQTGVGFNELGAAIATITKSGIQTSEAMSGLRGALSAVLKQSDQSVKMAKELGVEFNATALEAKGLSQFLADIANSGATTEQMAKLFGRVEGLTAVLSLGAENSSEFNKQLAEMEKAAGATEEAVARMMGSTAFQAARAQQAFASLGIEIGQRFLSSVSGAATTFVRHIDDIIAAVEALVVLISIRAGLAVSTAFLSMATSATSLATAMAFLGGPVGAAIITLTSLVLLIQRNIEAANTLTADYIELTDAIDQTTDAWLRQADSSQIAQRQAQIREKAIAIDIELLAVREKLAVKTRALAESEGVEFEEIKRLRAEEKRLVEAYNEALDALKKLNDQVKRGARDTVDFRNAIGAAQKRVLAIRKATDDLWRSVSALGGRMGEFNKRIRAARSLIDDATRSMEATKRATDEYDRSLQSLMDTLFPVEAAGRQLAEDLAILTREYEAGRLSLNRYETAVRRATDAMTGFSEETGDVLTNADRMREALLEGTRILERAFTDMWENILDGSQDVFDSILDGFKSLLANLIHQATTQKIILNIQSGISGKGLNLGQLVGDLATFAGVIGGSQLGGGGQGAGIGSALGALAGGALAAQAGPIGIAIGKALGGALGGILGGLFDREFKATLGGTGVSAAADAQFLKTLLGGVVGVSGQGGFGDLNDPSTPGGEIGEAIRAFDKAIFEVLSAAGATDELNEIVTALETWRFEMGEGAGELQRLLDNRFSVVLASMTDDVQTFVKAADDIESQLDRLGVALQVDKILDSGLLSGSTRAEFLAVVEAFQDGTETIVDAFNEVLELLNLVVSVQTSLKDFAASDLGSDFQAALDSQGITLAQALDGLNEGLFNAIANFDGSIESLQEIGLIVSSIREGEIKLLSQIDAIQKGLSANLDKLRADILGVTEGPKSAEELFNQAQSLIVSLTSASDAQEIAAIGQQFEALIRQISPEDQGFFQTQILQLIDNFRSVADAALEAQKQTALDNAQSTRELVDLFVTDIGDPLDIIAATNDQAALSLANIEESNNEIAEAVNDIGPVVANALRGALGDVNVQVTVVTDDRGLTVE